MLVVRNCFVAKPGNATKLAAQLKESAAVAKIPNHRVLTDLTGDFNRVILEFEVENVAGFEARLKSPKIPLNPVKSNSRARRTAAGCRHTAAFDRLGK